MPSQGGEETDSNSSVVPRLYKINLLQNIDKTDVLTSQVCLLMGNDTVKAETVVDVV